MHHTIIIYTFLLTRLSALAAAQVPELSNVISFDAQQFSECLAVAQSAACHPFAIHPGRSSVSPPVPKQLEAPIHSPPLLNDRLSKS